MDFISDQPTPFELQDNQMRNSNLPTKFVNTYFMEIMTLHTMKSLSDSCGRITQTFDFNDLLQVTNSCYKSERAKLYFREEDVNVDPR